MDEIQRPAPLENLRPAGQFFILLGIALILMVGFSFLGVAVATAYTHLSVFDLQGTAKINNPEVIRALKIIQAISVVGSFIIPTFIMALLCSRKWLEFLNIKGKFKVSTFLLGGILILVAVPVINYLSEVNSHLQLPASMQSAQDWIKNMDDENNIISNAFIAHQSIRGLIVNIFIMGFLAAVSEELFFRAGIQKIIIRGSGNIHVGVWLTAIIFSAIHLEFFGFLPRMLMGAYLGYLFVWSKSIWPSIFAHFLNNSVIVYISYLEDRNMLPKKIEDIGNQSSQISYVIGSTILVAVLMFAIYKIEHRKTDTLQA